MNRPIFQCEVRGQDTHYFINKVLSSPKCGIINPKVDKIGRNVRLMII